MGAVLVTGMSGVGKSSVADELTRRGYLALDTDADAYRIATDGEWLWDEPKIDAALEAGRHKTVFVVGSAPNQVKFYHRFARIVLLSAPTEVMIQRVRTRTNNPFGQTAEQQRKILADKERVEPMIRRRAHAEIVTDQTLRDVVDELLAIVDA